MRLALACALALCAAAPGLAAQEREPARPDTVAADSIVLVVDTVPAETAAARPRRTPFAVRASGRPEPGRYRREVVWAVPDTIRRDTARGDSIRPAEVDSAGASADSAGAERDLSKPDP
ncbi:MAG TPA: hypothetical protein VFX98_03655, partial [Longimicrobiaceae bacterium]|nr:hypothetical protein [Longimicrobiaceae bacterium]